MNKNELHKNAHMVDNVTHSLYFFYWWYMFMWMVRQVSCELHNEQDGDGSKFLEAATISTTTKNKYVTQLKRAQEQKIPGPQHWLQLSDGTGAKIFQNVIEENLEILNRN